MKTKTIKTDQELFNAIMADVPDGTGACELIKRDDSVIGVRVGRLRVESFYGLTVTRELDHEEVEKHRVRVDHPNFPTLNRYFDDDREAEKFAEPYRAIDGATVDAALVTARVDAQGAVIAELNAVGDALPLAPQENGGDEIPF